MAAPSQSRLTRSASGILIPFNNPFTQMNLGSAFLASTQKHPGKTALFWGDEEFTYGKILRQAQWTAARLQQDYGVQPGHRIGVWLKNCPEYIPALFGIFFAGGIAVPINNFLKPYELNYILEDAGIDVFITDPALAASLSDGSAPKARVFSIADFVSDPASAPESWKPVERSDSCLALIIYTSGTTGRPKGAMLTHGNLLHNVESCRQMLQVIEEDRFVLLLPMFHSFMLCVCLLLPLLSGSSILLVKSLHPPKNILQEILARNATLLPAIPQFFRTLIHAPLPPNIPLRLCVSGAAPLPHEVLKEFTAKFPIPLLEGYGLSEASPVVSMNPISGPWKPGSVGVPVPNVEVTIQNEAGEILPSHQIGELCVRGGNVMPGYWNRPEETADTLRRGWLLTGDLGYEDADGYLFITDRKKDMLLVNGINVYPREIEEVLYQFPGVKEAAVIGIPDARKGEQPVAYIAPDDGVALDETAILQFLRGKLADYKVPKKIISLPALPRNVTGKILKTELRAGRAGRWDGGR
jgi:long-chain acyl-CoA synthetase